MNIVVEISESCETRASASDEYPFTSRWIEAAGHRVHYVEQGAGKPVQFVHGTRTSSYVWRNVLAAVADKTGR